MAGARYSSGERKNNVDCTALLRKKTKKERCIMKRIASVLVVLVLAVAALGNQRVPKVEFIKGKNKIDVMVGGEHFTSYIYGNELTKPMMVPLRSPREL